MVLDLFLKEGRIMKKHRLPALLLALLLCCIAGAAPADTHTIAELGLTFETPEDWLFVSGGRAEIWGHLNLPALYDAMRIDGTCLGMGTAYAGQFPAVVWSISSYEQPAWWIQSYQGLSDSLLQEMNGAPDGSVLHGKAAKLIAYEESNADATAFSAFTIEGGRGIYIAALAYTDVPEAAQQVRDMLASFSFGKPTPAPARAPALPDAVAWDSAFASMEKTIDLPAQSVDAAVADLFVGYPLTVLRLYADDALFLALLGDADGTLREVFIGHDLADIAQSETLLAEAFDAFSATAAMAMAVTAEQTGRLALEANAALVLDAMDKSIFDENYPYTLFYDWNGLDLEVGIEEESLLVYVDLFL
jgi:hypothetical protein